MSGGSAHANRAPGYLAATFDRSLSDSQWAVGDTKASPANSAAHAPKQRPDGD